MSSRFDIFAPDFRARRDDILRALLDEAPVMWHEEKRPADESDTSIFARRGLVGHRTGYWTVARHEDVLTVKRHPEIFSNFETTSYGMTPNTFEWEIGHRRLSNNDGAYHDVVRRLCGRQLRPSVLRTFNEALATRAKSGLDRFEERIRSGDTVDWVRNFAYMYPVFAVGILIGMPVEVLDRFADQYATGTPPSDDELETAFREFVADRAKNPQDDMASDLVNAIRDGNEFLTLESLHYVLLGFYLAGHLTTTHLMAWVMVEMQRQPGLTEMLKADRELIPGFVEETLRVDPPVVATFNTVLEDTDMIGGVEMKKGQHVFSVYAAANRDPQVFEHPERFDVTRNPNPHLAFSHGTHFCLGAPMARLETRMLIDDLLSRDLDLHVDVDNAVLGQNFFHTLRISAA
ncbi:MAG: cytochrome P450 [Acidimicrobiia bacterium]